ncbi:TetR/AcrR family transcriptional regulator [Gandjariella thermophila]|uniref:TetR family transcriptional regulator n=1 Tax=Gandjariella thermophila TaxID=1931992 RepID=A0A4D4J8I9_9PSEU|nr:TetR/AcrR family transcriptional regulator [Gandjariella thermophila]GDY33125.1 TetR family transcriptional regulator [Gandjariella thermophila]
MTEVPDENGKGKRKPAGAAVLQESVTSAILRAAFAELAETGYARMSMDAVAKRARVGKAAIYRRWTSKQDMVVALSAQVGVPLAEIADTGSLRGDLLAYLRATSKLLRHPLASQIVPDLLAEGAREPVLAQVFADVVERPRRERATELLQRAVERGELPPDMDTDLALDLLFGPLYWRLMVSRERMPPGYVDRLADTLLAALVALPSVAAHA